MTTDQLKQFGLSDKESRVYLGLLELGPSLVTDIAIKAEINRTTTYDILESLINYHLVSRVAANKKSYVAENPEQLLNFIKKKTEEFKEKTEQAKEMLPELKSIYNLFPRRPKVKYYEGEEGIITIYEDSLTAKTEILSWLNANNTADFAYDYFQEYYKRRAAKHIHIKAIVNDTQISHEIHSRDKSENREMRIIPEKMMNIGPECYIYDDKVAYMSLKEKFGVIIESKEIADAQRAIYNLAWEFATKYLEKSN